MIPHDGLIARHVLHDVGHEKTYGEAGPYQQAERRAEQWRERCEQVGNGSGPEPERRQDRLLVPRPCLTRALSHDHGRSELLFLSKDRSYLQVGAMRACSCIAFSTLSIRSVSGRLPLGRACKYSDVAPNWLQSSTTIFMPTFAPSTNDPCPPFST